MTTATLLFVGVAFFSSLISAVFGFGTALLVIGLGTHLLPAKDVIVLATVLFTASTLSKSLVYRRQIDWRLALFMALASFPFAYLGASLLPLMSADLLRQLLGGMIMVYLMIKYLGSSLPDWSHLKDHKPALLAVSAVYGFCSGLLGSGNIIKAIFFRELKLCGAGFVGVMAATSVLSNVAKLGAFSHAGLLQPYSPLLLLALCIAAVSAVVIGRCVLARWVLSHLDARRYRYCIDIILAISAAALWL